MEENRVLLITTRGADESDKRLFLKEREIRSLLNTLSVNVVFHQSFPLREINANTYIGKGQAESLSPVIKYYEADEVVIDAFLSARQENNLERIFGVPVNDREGVILSIFFQNAHSKEAKLQIEKAEREYLLPRLKNREANFSQQRGGVRGAKGEGERQIELSRRLLSSRIYSLDKEIEKIKKIRRTQRKKREEEIFSFALTGYTNAGKSSLLRALTGSPVLVEDKLFATLDTTTRKMRLKNGIEVLISDTVGFITNLPHRLIDAFSSTLEEALSASAIIIVSDLSHPDALECFETTKRTLSELGAEDKIALHILNKTDAIYDDLAYYRLKNTGIKTVECSVKEKKGLDCVMAALSEIAEREYASFEISVKNDGRLYSSLPSAAIVKAEYEGEYVKALIRVKKTLEGPVKKIIEELKA